MPEFPETPETRVSSVDKGAYTLLTVSGRLDAASSPAFDEAARALGVPPAKDVVVDLAGMGFLSSSGLRSFLALAKSARKAGRRTAFCSLSPAAEEIFRIAGFMSILTVLPDAAAAARALASP